MGADLVNPLYTIAHLGTRAVRAPLMALNGGSDGTFWAAIAPAPLARIALDADPAGQTGLISCVALRRAALHDLTTCIPC